MAYEQGERRRAHQQRAPSLMPGPPGNQGREGPTGQIRGNATEMTTNRDPISIPPSRLFMQIRSSSFTYTLSRTTGLYQRHQTLFTEGTSRP